MRTQVTARLLGLIVLACATAVGIAQVVPRQPGRVLDRSPLVGSGGYNAPTGSVRGVNDQLFVNGLLQGAVGRLEDGNLLSRSIQYGSAGYNRVRGGVGGVNPQLYINRQAGAANLIRGSVPYTTLRRTGRPVGPSALGRTQPQGTLGTGTAATLRPGAAGAATAALRPLATGGSSAVVPLMPRDTAAELVRRGKVLPPRPDPTPVKAGSLALLGVLRPADQETLVSQLQRRRVEGNRLDYRKDLRVDLAQAAGAAAQERVGWSAAAPVGRPDLDVFTDIRVAMQEIQAGLPPRTSAGTAQEPGSEGTDFVQRSAEKGIVVYSLAGRRRDEFNVHLARAQALLKEGKYYSAAAYFEVAVTSRPNNPLAQIGHGLALLGAGECLSAARFFRAALEQYPPLKNTRFDFTKMTDASNLTMRTTEVNEMVNAGPDAEPSLVFLATFLHFNAGRTVDSSFYAKKLAKVAAEDSFLASYADFVLTTGAGTDGKTKEPSDAKQ